MPAWLTTDSSNKNEVYHTHWGCTSRQHISEHHLLETTIQEAIEKYKRRLCDPCARLSGISPPA